MAFHSSLWLNTIPVCVCVCVSRKTERKMAMDFVAKIPLFWQGFIGAPAAAGEIKNKQVP